mgnify:CR=1 FL=1
MDVLEYLKNAKEKESTNLTNVFEELINNQEGSIIRNITMDKPTLVLKIFFLDNTTSVFGIKSKIIYAYYVKEDNSAKYKHVAVIRDVLRDSFIDFIKAIPHKDFSVNDLGLFITFDTQEFANYLVESRKKQKDDGLKR